MVDASKGFMKDGPKNRLRSQDIHRIVDTFNAGAEKPGYSRHGGFDEIERNEFNLNLLRYIESQETEDTQDIAGHLFGGIPPPDIGAMQEFWDVCPTLRKSLFKEKTVKAIAIWRSTWPRSKPRSSSILSSPTTFPA